MEYITGEITNKKIYDFISSKGNLITEGREISKEIEELERKRDSLGLRIQKIKDKVVPMIIEELKDKMPTEFHEIISVEIEDGKLMYKIADRVEMFKEAYLEAKQQELNQNNDVDKQDKTDNELGWEVKTS